MFRRWYEKLDVGGRVYVVVIEFRKVFVGLLDSWGRVIIGRS